VLVSVILFFQVTHVPSAMAADPCIPGWYVTGYYTPHESDFSGNLMQIQAEGQSLQVKEDFIDEIKTEGWGKLETGLYLGWYDSMYHLSPDPLDAHDTALSEISLAADPAVLSQGITVRIPTLPSPFDEILFTINDVGPSIKGKHVDVYTGEGRKAYQNMFRITGNDNIICLETTSFRGQMSGGQAGTIVSDSAVKHASANIPENQYVGGFLIPLDTTALLLAGTQMTAAWMIPVIVSAIGFAIVIARKF